MGLEHQEATGQGQVAGEPRPLAAGGLLHHLDEHLLAGLEQLGDAGATFFQAQRTEISDVNKPVLFTFANIDEGGVDAGEHIFDGAEVDVADLVAALGHHQLIDTLVGEHCGYAQLLGDDDLLGHGESLFGSVSPASGGRKDGRGKSRCNRPAWRDQNPMSGGTDQRGSPTNGGNSGCTPCSDRGRRWRRPADHRSPQGIGAIRIRRVRSAIGRSGNHPDPGQCRGDRTESR